MNDTGSRSEYEYLAALMLFKDGTLRADHLSTAVEALVEGNATSLFQALNQASAMTADQLLAAKEHAKLCSDLIAAKVRYAKAKHRGQLQSPPVAFFDEADESAPAMRPTTALSGPVIAHKFQSPPFSDDFEETTSPSQGSNDFQGSDFLAEGRAGKSQRATWVHPTELDPAELDPTASFVTENDEDFEWRPTGEFLSHVYLFEDTIRSFTGGMLGITSSLALLVCLGLTIWGLVKSGALDGLITPTANMVASGDQKTAPLAQNDAARGNNPENENSGTKLTSNPAPENEPTPAPAPAPEVPEEIDPETLAQRRLDAEVLIESKVKLASQDISRLDSSFAMSRMQELWKARSPGFDLSIDTRWLMLGASLLLEDVSIPLAESSAWIVPLLKSDNAQVRLIYANWLLKATPDELDALKAMVTADGGSAASTTMINWMFAARGNQTEVIDAIRAEIDQQLGLDPLNYLFLSVAYAAAGRRDEADKHLREFLPYVTISTQWSDASNNPESLWIRQKMLARLKSQVTGFKKKLDTSPAVEAK